MKKLLIVAMFAMLASCVDSSPNKDLSPQSPKQGESYLVNDSTIERYRVNSDIIEMYTPGAPDVGLYNQVTGQVSVVPANSGMVSQLIKGAEAAKFSSSNVIEEDDGGDGRSCSGGKQDCFCTGSCCRDSSHCWCSGC